MAHIQLFTLGMMVLCGQLGFSQPRVPITDDELYTHLRKNPSTSIVRGAERVDVVNARHEPCTRKKEVRYLRVVSPTDNGYIVRIIHPNGSLVMAGTCTDATGEILHGATSYYDDWGRLRAEGNYVHGRKMGVWHRYDMLGHALPDKEYDGLDWDAKQVKLGLASLSRPNEGVARQ